MKKNQISEDGLWIERFLSGDAEGFTMLVRKYQNRVLNIVYSLIGQDRESEDIMQEVFMKVYHSLKSFRQQSQFSTWLYRIVMNTSYDFLRRRKHFVRDDGFLERSAVAYEGPLDTLLTREKEAMIQKALGNIPLKFRAAVVLKDIEGLSYIKISRVLRCSIGTVESKIYRARQFLKEELLKLEGDTI
jgi:RNA polymerase sigma-70 factor (ECF subfamily)